MNAIPGMRAFIYWAFEQIPDRSFVFCVNLLHQMKLSSVSVEKNQDNNFSYSDGGQLRSVSHRLRGLRWYHRGFGVLDNQVIQKYGLDKVKVRSQGVVVDCGANYGDVFFALSKCVPNFEYFGIEPDPNAFEVLKSNIGSQGLCFDCALGERNSDAAKRFI